MDFQRERKRERLHEPFPIKSQTFRKQLTWINRTKITPLKSLVHHSNEATVASSELSIFLPPSPPIRWIHEIFSIPKNSKRGEDLFRNPLSFSLLEWKPPPIPSPLVQSPRKAVSFRFERVKVVALGSSKIENYGRSFAKSFSLPSPFLSPISISLSRRSLDPIISCPLSGSVCYAIGLRGLDRRAVCFVSLIAVRGGLSPVVLSLSLLFFFLFHISLSFARSFPFFTLFFPVPCNVAAPPARPPFYF